ncbi:MAG: hypothetical protein SPJ65_01985 [Roseburia sp.]|nr:hypothetical protein [Roseburia sp.]
MEYTQITLNDWMEMKDKLRRELLSVRQSFVRIGYMLRQVEDQKLYEKDGYKSVAEFAQKELSLHPTTTSRFMEINREYSVDGYSERLDEKYMDFGRSQLEEMLKLPEDDRQMITPQTPREDIRELKRFNAAGPEQGADDMQALVAGFLKDNAEITDDLYHSAAYEQNDTDKMTEIVIPSGNKTYKKGLYFLSMTENDIKIKKFGGSPETMTWEHFFELVRTEFEQNPPKEEEPQEEKPVETEKPVEQKKDNAETEKPEETPKTLHDIQPDIPEPDPVPEPGEQPEEKEEELEQQLPGQDSVEDHPEWMPEDKKTADSYPMNPPENLVNTESETTIPVSKEITDLQGIILNKVEKLVANIKGAMWQQALMDLRELEEDVTRAQSIEDSEAEDEEV